MSKVGNAAAGVFGEDVDERKTAAPNSALKGKRVLVVDDNLINLDIAVETLSDLVLGNRTGC